MEHKADRTVDVLSLSDNSLGQMKNTNRQLPAFAPVGDANANEILSGETGTRERGWKDGSPVPPLVSQNDTQDRIIIWDTDAECQDVALEELELLECQELEAFLRKRGKNEYRSIRGEGRMKGVLLDRQPKTTTTTITTSSGSGSTNTRGYQQNNNNHWRTRGSVEELECCSIAQSYTSESLRKARSNSEGNVFASSSLSTVPNFSSSLASALDSAGSHLSQYVYPTSAQSRGQQHQAARDLSPEVDQNHNTMLPQGRDPGKPNTLVQGYAFAQSNANRKYLPSRLVAPKQRLEEVCVKTDWRQDVSGRQANGASSERKKSCDERVPPCRRQLVRPFLSETNPEHTSWGPDPTPQPPFPSADVCHAINNKHPVHRATSHVNGSSQYSIHGSGSLKGKSSTAGPSSLERKAPVTPRLCRSPSGADSPPSPRDTGSPRRHPSTSPPKPPPRGYASTPQGVTTTSSSSSSILRAPYRTSLGTGIPKPPVQERAFPPPPPPHERSSPPKCPPKPKSVRPKIITYVRKGPPVKVQPLDGPPHQVSSLPGRLGSYTGTQVSCEANGSRGENLDSPVLSASNLLFDKYRQEMQKAQQFKPTGVVGSGIKTTSYTVPHKQPSRADSFYGSLNSKCMPGGMNRPSAQFGSLGPGHTLGSDRAPQRALRPQLGVAGAVRGPTNSATKNRTFPAAGQNQPVQAVSPAPQNLQNSSGPLADLKKPVGGLSSKSLLPKPSLSGLRPPGYSRLPPSRLTAFGFVRSSSVSSVSSTHSGDSILSDPCRPAFRPSSVSDEPPFHRIISSAPGGAPRVSCQGSPQPPATPAPKRRSLLLPPAPASKKELQKNPEIARPALSSPKRLAVVSPKPQSPVPRQRPVAAVQRVTLSTSPQKNAPEPAAPQKEGPSEQEVHDLQERCEEQARQLELMRAELKKTTLGLEAFAICTQHLCLQSQSATEKEKELSLELDRIKDKVAWNKEQLEHIQREKAELELNFHQEVRELQGKQGAELTAMEMEMRSRHSAELEHLRAEHQSEVEELRTQQLEQIDEMAVNHASAMEELRTMQDFTMATVQEEHTRTMRDLRKAHEQHKSKLEEDFQHFRFSLQDQVDTLTFQNQTLKDKAKRFEEALRRSSDEQIVDALAPYQHIEEDLKSLKDVLEMKNQQIHDQEKKISELEKMAHKNVVLEERVQVLQQQNEDLKARINNNLSISRHLSEENATLQVSVEKESNEKKRLSRNNEELLWRLQMGELSPRMSPCASPSHRSTSFFPASAEIPPYPYSPGPGTPTHGFSPGPGTPPTHRALPLSGPSSPAPRNSPARALSACVNTQ